ncbi:MAG: hypothetical protein F6J90_20500 [Moorea sp. SIOASIH]|nr:hypothetical protein [Moorena sp. SIOASIH]
MKVWGFAQKPKTINPIAAEVTEIKRMLTSFIQKLIAECLLLLNLESPKKEPEKLVYTQST